LRGTNDYIHVGRFVGMPHIEGQAATSSRCRRYFSVLPAAPLY